MFERGKYFINKYAWHIIGFTAISLRLYYYVLNPSFFLDEVRTVAYLYGDIDWYFGITWPIGQLELVRIISQLFGYSEYVLRLTPLLGSFGSLIVIALLMKEWLGERFSQLLILLLAISPLSLQFSIEFKQYSLDLFISSLFLYTFTLYLKEKSIKNLVINILVSSIGIVFSYPLIFTISGSMVFYFLTNKIEFKINYFKTYLIGLLSLISFGILYTLIVSKSTGAEGLVDYWNDYYMPTQLSSLLKWIPFIISDTLKNTLGFKSYATYLGFILITTGMILLIYEKKFREIFYFFLPLVFVLIASIFQKYPFGERVIFFMLPSLFVPVTYALFRLKELNKILFVPMYLITLLSLGYVSYIYMNGIVYREPVRQVMEQMKKEYVSETPIIVTGTAKNSWKYYNRRFDINSNPTFSSWDQQDILDKIGDLDKETWVVWSHIAKKNSEAYLEFLRQNGDISKDLYLKEYPTTRAVLFIPNRD